MLPEKHRAKEVEDFAREMEYGYKAMNPVVLIACNYQALYDERNAGRLTDAEVAEIKHLGAEYAVMSRDLWLLVSAIDSVKGLEILCDSLSTIANKIFTLTMPFRKESIERVKALTFNGCAVHPIFGYPIRNKE